MPEKEQKKDSSGNGEDKELKDKIDAAEAEKGPAKEQQGPKADEQEEMVKRLQEEEKEVDDYTAGFYEKYTKMMAEARDFFKGYGVVNDEQLKEAALKFVLSNPYTNTITYDFRNFTEVSEVLRLSGTKLNKETTSLLKQYRRSFGHLTCRIGCSECEQACPHDIPVNTIMRYNYYCEVKQEEQDAMEKYARITKSKPAEVCGECPGYCEQACPHGVSTRALLASAEYNLGFGKQEAGKLGNREAGKLGS